MGEPHRQEVPSDARSLLRFWRDEAWPLSIFECSRMLGSCLAVVCGCCTANRLALARATF